MPEEAWATTPDVDELYHYPCMAMRGLVARGTDLFCGVMEDMLAASGGLERLRVQPDIQAQYPIRCRVRSFLKHFTYYKVVLARVRPPALGGEARQFRSVHAFTTTDASASSPDCHRGNKPMKLNASSRAPRASTRVDVGPLTHYTLTRQQVPYTYRKMQMHNRNHEERKRTRVKNKNWTPCGSFAKDEPNTPLAERRCIDYERILYAMGLIYKQSRGEGAVPAKLCRMPPNMTWPPASSAPSWDSLLQRKVHDA